MLRYALSSQLLRERDSRMANPQPSDAHLRIAHSIQEQIMVSNFTEQQRRILDLILRLSWGCGSKVAHIPHQNTFELVGVGNNKIKSHLVWLESAGVIGRDGCFYWICKDYDKWRVSRALEYTPAKVAELVTFNIRIVAEKGTFCDEKLPNREQEGCRIGNNEVAELGTSSDTNLASLKERLKKELNKVVSEDVMITGGVIIKAQELWQRTLEDLKNRVSPANYKWFSDTVGVGTENSTFFVRSPTKFSAEQIHHRIESHVIKSLSVVSGKQYEVCFVPL